MPYVAPSTVAAGDAILASAQNVIVNDIIDHELYVSPIRSAWTSFTPTLSGGFANGNATTGGGYCQTGKIVHFWGFVTTGSTSTYGSILRISLPVAAKSNDVVIGIKSYATVGGNSYVLIAAPGSTASNIELTSTNVAGTYATLAQTTATVPATWGTGAVIRYAGTYEAA